MSKPHLIDQDPDEEIRAHLVCQAHELVRQAQSLGFVISITHEPIKPLAMGNFKHVVDARPARKRAS
jgi:hypothetical protein